MVSMRTLIAAVIVSAVLLSPLLRAQAPAPAAPLPLYAAEHSANLATLRAAGTIVMGARYADVDLVVVTAATEADARKLFADDPSIAAGTFTLDVHRFAVFHPGLVGTPPAPK